ncbi:MAG: hypothetical protein E7495_02165 [Ruminococcus flavefaciens]|jgi:hypothetical protein|nr:hypothetical protein [Ruminococcus flavefaciens]
MKRIIALMSAAIIAAGMLTSCRKTYPYDTDKAISLATEYMKNKYGKDIKDIETYKKTHGSDAYIGVKFKLDETDNESSDDNTYEVRVYVDGEGEENHYVKCDNFMRTLVNPYLKEGLSNILDENGFENYSLGIITSDQNETGSFNYFMKEFVFHEDKKIDEMFKENHFDLKYRIFFPQKSFDNSYLEKIRSIYAPLFDDDYVRIKILVFKDSDYEEIINTNSSSTKNIKELKNEEIVFNNV